MLWRDAPTTLGADEDFFRTPIFIQNFNQRTYLQRLLNWLLAAGYRNICIIDNNSTYSPLLQLYGDLETSSPIKVLRRGQMGGRCVLWDDAILDRFGVSGPFVYTDSDIVPDWSCPNDIIGQLAKLLREHREIFKAGLGLRIDNLPARYQFRDDAFHWEKQFWMAPVLPGAFLAPIDTTFALYRPDSVFETAPALRTGWPYLARHETWYQDSANLCEEDRYYRSEVESSSRSHWARSELPGELRGPAKRLAQSTTQLLHLGCGHQTLPGWINLDRRPAPGVDVVFDLEDCSEKALPLNAGSVDGFFMPSVFDLIIATLPMMQELYRVAKPDARLIIRLAYDGYGNRAEANKATHRYLSSSFFRYAQPVYTGSDYDYTGDWQVKRIKLVVQSELVKSDSDSRILERIPQERNIVRKMIVELRAVKPARPRIPHLLEWPSLTISTTELDTESNLGERFPAL
jgi:hypothetical protein